MDFRARSYVNSFLSLFSLLKVYSEWRLKCFTHSQPAWEWMKESFFSFSLWPLRGRIAGRLHLLHCVSKGHLADFQLESLLWADVKFGHRPMHNAFCVTCQEISRVGPGKNILPAIITISFNFFKGDILPQSKSKVGGNAQKRGRGRGMQAVLNIVRFQS